MWRAFVILSLVWFNYAYACCMVPKNYAGSISQSAQKAILFHHQGREELIISINYRIKGKKMPNRFAWVITVPNQPDSYHLAKKKIFSNITHWAYKQVTPSPSGFACAVKSKITTDSKGLKFGKRKQIGPYDIQPVKALGLHALEGLNKWLTKNNFPTEKPEQMKYFIKNGFTFLCIKISPYQGEQEVSAAGELPPLHLSFKSEKIYYPLLFSSRQGVFDLDLFMLTAKPLDYNISHKSLKKINWQNRLLRNVRVLSSSFPSLLESSYKKSKFTEDKWYLNVIRGYKVNDGNSIHNWKKDIFFHTKLFTQRQISSITFVFIVVLLIFIIVIFRRKSKLTQSSSDS